jgi:DNA-binding NarL/FixJ family response regulator
VSAPTPNVGRKEQHGEPLRTPAKSWHQQRERVYYPAASLPWSVPAAAHELKISRETARNQLKSVFAKTDTHRQSELVALFLQVE